MVISDNEIAKDTKEPLRQLLREAQAQMAELRKAMALAAAHLRYHHIDRMSRDEVATLLDKARVASK